MDATAGDRTGTAGDMVPVRVKRVSTATVLVPAGQEHDPAVVHEALDGARWHSVYDDPVRVG